MIMSNGRVLRWVPGGVEIITPDWTVKRFIANSWYDDQPEFDGIPVKSYPKSKRHKSMLKQALERS